MERREPRAEVPEIRKLASVASSLMDSCCMLRGRVALALWVLVFP